MLIKLPGCFSYSGDLALVCEFSEADTANSVLTHISMGTAADLASIVLTGGELLRSLLLNLH